MTTISQEHLLPIITHGYKLLNFDETPMTKTHEKFLQFLISQSIPFNFIQRNHSNLTISDTNFFSKIQKYPIGKIEILIKDELSIRHIYNQFFSQLLNQNILQIEPILLDISFPTHTTDYYKNLGLISFSQNEKHFFTLLVRPPKFPKPQYYRFDNINLPYFLKNKNAIFNNYDIPTIRKNWELCMKELVRRFSFSSEPKTKNTSQSQKFLFELIDLLLFEKDSLNNKVEILHEKYKDYLTHPNIFQFYKNNKSHDIQHSFNCYKQIIETHKQTTINLEVEELLQFKVTVKIDDLMKKHLISDTNVNNILLKLMNFFKSQNLLRESTYSKIDQERKFIFHLNSLKFDELSKAKNFLEQVLNNKDFLFIPIENLPSLYLQTHLKSNLLIQNKTASKPKL